jgi:hypothetical protein
MVTRRVDPVVLLATVVASFVVVLVPTMVFGSHESTKHSPPSTPSRTPSVTGSGTASGAATVIITLSGPTEDWLNRLPALLSRGTSTTSGSTSSTSASSGSEQICLTKAVTQQWYVDSSEGWKRTSQTCWENGTQGQEQSLKIVLKPARQ